MLAKSALLLLSVMCFSFHKNFSAESRWRCVAWQDASQPDIGNNGVAKFLGNKSFIRTSNGYAVEAYNHYQNKQSFAKITFQKDNQGKIVFSAKGFRLYSVHPLAREGDKVSLYVVSHDPDNATDRFYKCIFALVSKKAAEAKEE